MRTATPILTAALATAALVSFLHAAPQQAASSHTPATPRQGPPPTFADSSTCIACHLDIVTPRGENVSFVNAWRPTMMANSARDPYWHAGVRREVTDHPTAKAVIEDECSACHMPMARTLAVHGGGHGEVFTNLPAGQSMAPHATLAADGVSCALCHQITPEGLGTRASFNASFKVAPAAPGGSPAIYGPYEVDPGRMRLMRSSSGFEPKAAGHIQESDLCGSCHTLFTTSLGPNGETIGELPEQMPYLEWQHSAYAKTKSCQACHMPVIDEPVAISSVVGQPRTGVARHTFRGGNFFMQRLLAKHRTELGVAAPAEELDAAARDTLEYLKTAASTVDVATTRLADGKLLAEVTVANLGGHKLPTAYPSRRVWLHVVVRDTSGAVVFESGAVQPDGSIAGNDNDAREAAFEPHHREITSPDQVQIYEAIMGDPAGRVTTGLLTAVSYLKDNRLLPKGFDKTTAAKAVAVAGEAATDGDFGAGSDRVRYVIDVSRGTGPFTVEATVRYQTIAYRWAKNLGTYQSAEPTRFLRYYDSLAPSSSAVLATAMSRIN